MKTILFTNARDEDNILEWTAHHLNLGFDHIFIVDHKSIEPIKCKLKIISNELITIIRIDDDIYKNNLIIDAHNYAINNNYDWMIYLDADEFLILNEFQNVKEMLKRYSFADSIAINWLLFGTNHHKKEPTDGLIIENYTKSELTLNKHIKTFVRPSQVIDAPSPHWFFILDQTKMISINMKPMRHHQPFNECDISYDKCSAFIAHYLFQSEETYINRKINLPRDDNSEFRQMEENIHAKHNEIENLSVKNRYAERISILLKNLL